MRTCVGHRITDTTLPVMIAPATRPRRLRHGASFWAKAPTRCMPTLPAAVLGSVNMNRRHRPIRLIALLVLLLACTPLVSAFAVPHAGSAMHRGMAMMHDDGAMPATMTTDNLTPDGQSCGCCDDTCGGFCTGSGCASGGHCASGALPPAGLTFTLPQHKTRFLSGSTQSAYATPTGSPYRPPRI